MPTFLPRIPVTLAISLLLRPAWLSGYWLGSHIGIGQRPTTNDQRLLMFLAECLDLDVHTCGQVKFHQRIDGLLRWLENVEQALVCTDLKLLARFLVHVRRTQHAVFILHRGQGNWPRDLRARALRGFDNLTRGLIQDAIVVSLQPNTNSFFSNHCRLSLTPPGCPGRKNWRQTASRGFSLRHNLADRSCAYCVAAFANREAQTFFHSYRRDQLNHQAHVVARHHHFGRGRHLRYARHVRRSQIKLRTVSLEEWRMPPAFFFRQNINFRLELRMRSNRSRLRQHHAALDIVLANAAQEQPGVVSRQAFVQLLLEHFDAGHHRFTRVAEAHNFHFLAHLHLAALDSSRHHRAPARNRKNIFNRHQKRLVQLTRRLRHTLVHRLHQRVHLLLPLRFAVQRAQSRQPHHRHVIARQLVSLQQLAHFELNQIQQLGIVNRVAFVQRD